MVKSKENIQVHLTDNLFYQATLSDSIRQLSRNFSVSKKYTTFLPYFLSYLTIYHLWDNMCRKNSDKIHVLFSPSLCHPGSLELVCSWTTPQCESPQVINLAKSKCHFIFRQLLNNFKRSLLLNRQRFGPNSKTEARPEYQLSSGTKYTA